MNTEVTDILEVLNTLKNSINTIPEEDRQELIQNVINWIKVGRESQSTDLKWLLMTLGNKLVTEKGFSPPNRRPGDFEAGAQIMAQDRGGSTNTNVIALLTAWLNITPEVQEILQELGYKWAMTPNK